MTGIFTAIFFIFTAYGLYWFLGPAPAPVVYEEYIKSPEWREKARECKARAGWKCQRCRSKNDLQAHHRTYARLGHERPSDLECLCDDCHKAEHGIGSEPVEEKMAA